MHRRSLNLMLVLMLTALTVFAVPGSRAQAQTGPVITPDPGDVPLVIEGWLGENSSLTGDLRLMASADVDELIFIASDLLPANSSGVQVAGEKISRRNVQVMGGSSLAAGVPKDFQVTVSGIPGPGLYQGSLAYLLPGQTFADAKPIAIQVRAQARPALTLMANSDRLDLNLVNCRRGLDCLLAKWLLPDSAFIKQWMLQMQNKQALDAALVSSEVVIRGEKTGYQITSSQLSMPSQPTPIPANGMASIPLTIQQEQMPPDHYTGAIYLTLKDGSEPMPVPVSLNVRSGPLKPLLFLVFGILLGWLVKYMQTRGEPQAKALQQVNNAEILVEDAEPEDRAQLEAMLKRLRANVYAEKLADTDAQLQVIQARHDALALLRGLENSLAGKQGHTVVKAAQDKIAQARLLIYNGQDDQASQITTGITQSLVALTTPAMGSGQEDPEMKKASQQAGKAAEKMDSAARMTKKAESTAPAVSFGKRMKNWASSLPAWWSRVRAEGTLYIVRPLMYIILMIGLIVVGLNTLYVGSGTTFGASPIGDYLGLVLWGLSSDVASRTLGNLPGSGG
jgi:hypothetical protein